MEVKVFSKFPTFSANIITLEKDNHVLIVDLGYYSNELDEYLKDKQIDGLIFTHKHFDHTFGINQLLKKYPEVKMYSYNDGNDYFQDEDLNASFMIGGGILLAHTIDINPGINTIGKFKFNVIYTPGHTTDSISLIFDDYQAFISGDFIFPTSIGRTDLETGSSKLMEESLKKIKPYLNPDYTLYCGHDVPTLIKDVLKQNYYLN